MKQSVKLVVISLLVILSYFNSFSQDSNRTVEGFEFPDGLGERKLIASCLVGTLASTVLIDSYYSWWKDAYKPFSFYNEQWFSGHLGIDKVGHFYGANFLFHSTRTTLLWGGYEKSTALWWGIGIAGFSALEIEIGDGVSPYGFDYQDLLFNMAGIGYGVLQTEVPFFQNLNFKFSYWSQVGFKSPANFTQDYDAMTIWLAFNVHDLLPNSMAKYWPEFLQIAAGFGVDDNVTKREFALSFDINLEAWNFNNDHVLLTQKLLNRIHFPAPAVKFTENQNPTYDLFLLR